MKEYKEFDKGKSEKALLSRYNNNGVVTEWTMTAYSNDGECVLLVNYDDNSTAIDIFCNEYNLK